MEKVQNKVQGLGIEDKVIFTGVRQNVNKLYSVMDVFCLPSFYEGMPVVAWEAQANGLPCVFSNRVSSEAKQSENCCFLRLEQSVDDWTSAVLQSENRKENNIPDIQKYGKWLEEFYCVEVENAGN